MEETSNQKSYPEDTGNLKRRRGLGVVTPNACTECRKKRAKVSIISTGFYPLHLWHDFFHVNESFKIANASYTIVRRQNPMRKMCISKEHGLCVRDSSASIEGEYANRNRTIKDLSTTK